MPYRNGKKQLKGSGWDAATMPTMPMSVEKRGWEPPIGKKEDGKLPLGSRDDADHARGKDHHGLPCQAGVFGQSGRDFGAAFVHSFLNPVCNWSRDAELVSFPAFECFPGWSISRISVLSLINS